MRDNTNIINSDHEILKINKESYDLDLQIVNKSLTLKGLLTFPITKDLILKYELLNYSN